MDKQTKMVIRVVVLGSLILGTLTMCLGALRDTEPEGEPVTPKPAKSIPQK